MRRRNPTDKWTKIGEWWIDDSGNALYADGDNGDMGHEAYIHDTLSRRILNELGLRDDAEYVTLSSDVYDEDFTNLMEEAGIEDRSEFLEKTIRGIWKDKEQADAVASILLGNGDARKYGMQYDDWIRVAGHGFECWEMTPEVLRRMGDGLYDALDEGSAEIDDEEIFEIYVHKTGMHYTDVPWRVINEGDTGALRVYGTKNNPKRRRRRAR